MPLHTIKADDEVYIRISRKMRPRETYNDVLRRLLHLTPRARPWEAASPQQPVEASHESESPPRAES